VTIGPTGRLVTPALPLDRRNGADVFGSPTVTLKATATSGWSRLVVVLTAKTKAGKTIVISAGGVPTRPGTHTYTIRMISQMTYVPPGAKLSETFGSSSLAQNPANLLYLQLPMPAGAKLTIDTGSLDVKKSAVVPGY